jgi:hypothetical protein
MGITMNSVASQLLDYPYQHSEGKGVADAIQVARQWLEEIFKESWWPDDSLSHLVHHGNGMTCDAVKLSYRASDSEGPLQITVFQTLFLILVTVDRGPFAKLEGPDIARRLFNHAQRLNLIVTTGDPTGATGFQDSNGVPYRSYDWLDTIQWWRNRDVVGFELLKRTGPGQGTIVRSELEGNRTWFARFN